MSGNNNNYNDYCYYYNNLTSNPSNFTLNQSSMPQTYNDVNEYNNYSNYNSNYDQHGYYNVNQLPVSTHLFNPSSQQFSTNNQIKRSVNHNSNVAGGNYLHEKPFRCSICNQDFSRNHDLKRHQRIHTEVKPFIGICGKAFSRKDALKRHLLVKGCSNNSQQSSQQPFQSHLSQPTQYQTHSYSNMNANANANASTSNAYGNINRNADQYYQQQSQQPQLPSMKPYLN